MVVAPKLGTFVDDSSSTKLGINGHVVTTIAPSGLASSSREREEQERQTSRANPYILLMLIRGSHDKNWGWQVSSGLANRLQRNESPLSICTINVE